MHALLARPLQADTVGKIKAAATKLLKAHSVSVDAASLAELRDLQLVDEDALKGAKGRK